MIPTKHKVSKQKRKNRNKKLNKNAKYDAHKEIPLVSVKHLATIFTNIPYFEVRWIETAPS